MEYIAEPFKIKSVEPLTILSREEREKRIKEEGYNLFNLRAEYVYIDLMTDSGTGAMSQHQWAAMMTGDEAYAGAQSYLRLREVCRDIFGYAFFQPVHQGRAAEKLFMPIVLSEGKYAISNTFFDTTRAHVELAGATAVDCAVAEAADTETFFPFKGQHGCRQAGSAHRGVRRGENRRHRDDRHQQFRRRPARIHGKPPPNRRRGEKIQHPVCDRCRALRRKRLFHQNTLRTAISRKPSSRSHGRCFPTPTHS